MRQKAKMCSKTAIERLKSRYGENSHQVQKRIAQCKK